MNALLSKPILDTMRRTLYGSGAKLVFKKVTPTAGEAEIATITSGFHFQREQRAGQEIDGSGVNVWLAAGVVDKSKLHIGVRVDVTTNNVTTRYSISKLEPMQQLGAGFVLRLRPLQGATG